MAVFKLHMYGTLRNRKKLIAILSFVTQGVLFGVKCEPTWRHRPPAVSSSAGLGLITERAVNSLPGQYLSYKLAKMHSNLVKKIVFTLQILGHTSSFLHLEKN